MMSVSETVNLIRRVIRAEIVSLIRPTSLPTDRLNTDDGDVSQALVIGADRKPFWSSAGPGGPPTGSAGGVLGGTYPNPDFAVDMATQAELDAHLNDTSDAHDASAISNVAAGTISATDVQAALNELDTEKATTGSVSTVATDLANHIADTSDAHDASAISILDSANDFTATDVEGALAELQSDAEADALDLSNHLADTSDAHDASAISYVGGTGMSATDVEAAIDELANEKADTASAVMDGDTAGGDLTGTYPSPTIGSGKVTSDHIVNGTIVGGDLSSTIALPNGATATTQSVLDGSTKVATTAYADAASLLVVNSGKWDTAVWGTDLWGGGYTAIWG